MTRAKELIIRSLYRLVAVFVVLSLLAGCGPSVRPLPTARHSETVWNVRDSEAFEAIAFLNALTGDPLVAPHCAADVRHFQPMMSDEVKGALVRLAEFRDQTLHAHLSGFLMSFFLAGQAQTLDDLITLAATPDTIRKALKDYDRSGVEINVYYGDQGWQMFEETLPNLQVVFQFLKDADFAGYWRAGNQDQIRQEIDRITMAVRDRNIVPVIDMHVLSRVLHALMQQQDFPKNGEGYQDFLIRSVADGKLAPGKAEGLCCGGS